MAEASRDQNHVPNALGASSVNPAVTLSFRIDPATGRLLVDNAGGGGSGTVTGILIATANGFAGMSDGDPATPTLTLSTTVTGLVLGNGTALSAATPNVDYQVPISLTTVGSSGVATFDGTTLNIPNYATGGGGTPGGSDTDIQFNDAGSFGGDAALVFDKSTLSFGFNGGSTGSFGVLVDTSAAAFTMDNTGAILLGGSSLDLSGNTVIVEGSTSLKINGGGTHYAFLNTALLTTVDRIYTFPDKAGTFAMTSDIPAAGANTALSNLVAVAINTTLLPGANDGAALGSSTLSFSDLFLAAGGIINWNNGDITINNAATNQLNFTGASTGFFFDSLVGPLSNDGAPLGSVTNNWSDIFLATGAVINYNNGNVLITHTSGILTMGTGDFRVTNAGTNTASVVTVGGTQNLTAKTITAGTYAGAGIVPAGATFGLVVPTVDGTATGDITSSFNAGYTTALGDLVYLDASATWQLADADASATTYSGMLGIVLTGSITSGNPVAVLLKGFAYMATAFPTLTVGSPVYMSATAGAITQTAPTSTDSATRVLGWAVNADKMWFAPSADYITHV